MHSIWSSIKYQKCPVILSNTCSPFSEFQSLWTLFSLSFGQNGLTEQESFAVLVYVNQAVESKTNVFTRTWRLISAVRISPPNTTESQRPTRTKQSPMHNHQRGIFVRALRPNEHATNLGTPRRTACSFWPCCVFLPAGAVVSRRRRVALTAHGSLQVVSLRGAGLLPFANTCWTGSGSSA